ncbi:hypothetical protein BUALT_Bualt14G0081400 [Buddleja alternifolia]|uniref:Uncharacterized protein n=1 Tax=Buddleja alternifolia TaxID=168488 RepID=A0AAV6WSV9_9LAMI|nr:hypothetical protein BUALT_Bualt14G0081400 [Buddleja alternifolia]
MYCLPVNAVGLFLDILCLRLVGHCLNSHHKEFDETEISSHSLKCLGLMEISMWMKFDVPNIRKLIFSGKCFSRLSFTSCLKECESHTSKLCNSSYVKASWFHALKRICDKVDPFQCYFQFGVVLATYLGVDGPFARAQIPGTTSTSPHYGQKVCFQLKWEPSDGVGDEPKKKQLGDDLMYCLPAPAQYGRGYVLRL